MLDKLPLVPLPNGIEFNAKHLGDELYVGPFLVEPRPTVDFLMDVGAQNFRQLQLVNDRIETFRFRIAAVGTSVNDKEMDVVGASEMVEIFDFLAYPLRFG